MCHALAAVRFPRVTPALAQPAPSTANSAPMAANLLAAGCRPARCQTTQSKWWRTTSTGQSTLPSSNGHSGSRSLRSSSTSSTSAARPSPAWRPTGLYRPTRDGYRVMIAPSRFTTIAFLTSTTLRPERQDPGHAHRARLGLQSNNNGLLWWATVPTIAGAGRREVRVAIAGAVSRQGRAGVGDGSRPGLQAQRGRRGWRPSSR
jgi:hypothetical protein